MLSALSATFNMLVYKSKILSYGEVSNHLLPDLGSLFWYLILYILTVSAEDMETKLHRRTSYLMATAKDRSAVSLTMAPPPGQLLDPR